MIDNLDRILRRYNVRTEKPSQEKIFKILESIYEDRTFKQFINLLSSFIKLFKSNNYEISKFNEFKEIIEGFNGHFMLNRKDKFLHIVEEAYQYYQNKLNENDHIDFDDMINKATDYLQQNKVKYQYKYIIIDEFQDISISRYKLIKSMFDMTHAKLVCIGDDWQSIYRFTGSDINLITNFEKFFGKNSLLLIENTYRNSQELIDIAGQFVMKNPLQIKKNLSTDKNIENPIKIIEYKEYKVDALLKSIESLVDEYGDDCEIVLLGRNNFDIDFIRQNIKFKLDINSKENITKITHIEYPKLSIEFLTVHGSKGKEAENVIIINGENALVGFPNKISDDRLLSFVLSDKDQLMDYAEERRLFYVALTRTKNKVYILAPIYKKSEFVNELIRDFDILTELGTSENTAYHSPNCPKCKTGHLIFRKGKNDKQFLGCTNYPQCDYVINEHHTYVFYNPYKCPKCEGYLLKRGYNFYGCSNYNKDNEEISCGFMVDGKEIEQFRIDIREKDLE